MMVNLNRTFNKWKVGSWMELWKHVVCLVWSCLYSCVKAGNGQEEGEKGAKCDRFFFAWVQVDLETGTPRSIIPCNNAYYHGPLT